MQFEENGPLKIDDVVIIKEDHVTRKTEKFEWPQYVLLGHIDSDEEVVET